MPLWKYMVVLKLSNLEPYSILTCNFWILDLNFQKEKKKWSAQLGSCVCSLTNSSNPVQGEQWQMMQTWLPKAPSVIFYFLVTSSSFIDSLYFMTVFLKGYLKIFYVALWGILCEEVFFCSSSPLYGQKYVDYMFETC